MTPSNPIRWSILMLCVLTVIIVYTVPTILLPVLFAEIAVDLDLDIVQLGIAWGSLSLSSIFVGLFGGAIGDRLGSHKLLRANENELTWYNWKAPIEKVNAESNTTKLKGIVFIVLTPRPYSP